MENELTKVEINLNATNEEKLDESWLRMFGFGIESIMKSMFGGSSMPVTVKGTKNQVNSFAKTLGKEKNYLQMYNRYGLDDPRTYRSKYALQGAVKKFERATGLTWPFK